MKKTYGDVCLERAERAKKQGQRVKLYVDISAPELFEFIDCSFNDVPELARRLDRACKFINVLKDDFEKMARIDPALSHYLKPFEMILDELERMPGEK